ncbi:hypothetical protein [Paraburkholderia sp. DHOC27]|uniref:hypothetical protein n=1 Tax=Paraburkholderia sp. DHOC27 TaxID=2303330 RepID=UPI0011C1475A|nr:hypothetical protein [Paraburkholderia sp. DHOC27]
MRYLKAAALLAVCLACSAYGDDAHKPADGPGALLSVFDARGNYVGPVVGFEDRPLATVITVNGVTVVVPITRLVNGVHLSASKFEWSSSAGLYVYLSTNCSGPPVIFSSTMIIGSGQVVPVRPSLTIRTGSETTLYIAPDTYSTTLVGQSQVETPFGCFGPPGLTVTGWLPASTYRLDRQYPEPLTIRMDDRQSSR